MNFKIGEFVEDAKVVNIYTYEICDSNGNSISNPTFDFLKNLSQISLQDAQILKSQIFNTANVYGIEGRKEACSGREGLFALPSKYEDGEKITSRYRLYYWVLNGSTIIIGGGCHKPEMIDGIEIKTYQEVPECEDSAEELCTISKHIEMLEKKYGLSIDEIDKEEILEL
ncbi:hypothetical protein [Hyunsoonleella pacifica]|uniref:Uncharacterized protein n=1 Tax=Hyunsoonleella pacifica TaxID=1080224 RepID=A0A4Q9FLM8_9FLAO|nr:hypothetical protein [Hyunsoonleella pacifica]TBN14570.1 hypothetical protein EYD46_13445 [Hyunsoonleella pacifica]GGD14887.1 hypothetical protein GCM10011368_16030 [Hyunsoonleella pacifica]